MLAAWRVSKVNSRCRGYAATDLNHKRGDNNIFSVL